MEIQDGCHHKTKETNIFKLLFSDNTEAFEDKLGWNVPWVVLQNVCFCVDQKSHHRTQFKHRTVWKMNYNCSMKL